jgi:hypothetical protein
MSKRNYSRGAGSSLVPNSTRLAESERQEAMLSRVGKGKYYAGLSQRRSNQWKPVQPRMSAEEKEAQIASCRRKRLIAEIARKVQR